ncbi:MAG: hypothetical protein JWP85_546 [Rhodoglobus sp.]|nr:hypothetical protein [Rhodoglobus sp.]
MALDDHPNVFRFEGRLWVSEVPREDALRQFQAQRAWDDATAKAQRWWVAIGVGATVGVGAVLGLGITTGAPPVLYLFVLPIAFAFGAVLGAMINKRMLGAGRASSTAPTTPRPSIPALTRVPPRVAAKAPADASARDLIEWSKRGGVPPEAR